jgi:SAM-dependent methyltransferase
MIMDATQKAYSSPKNIVRYTKYETLQKGELSILDKFKTKINNGKVLNIGIGGGRTTSHLVPMAKEYTGIDYSLPFIDHCQARFGNLPHVEIRYGDARDLNEFRDHDFDFIFFSFNGIDSVDFDEGKKILAELSRLLKPDGVLSFSFHNKGNLDQLYKFQLPRNPFKYFWEWQRWSKIRRFNGDKEQYRHLDWFIIKDGGEDFTADTLYIDPIFQLQCLKEVGFQTFYFHDAGTGELIDASNIQKSKTAWIYITALK